MSEPNRPTLREREENISTRKWDGRFAKLSKLATIFSPSDYFTASLDDVG